MRVIYLLCLLCMQAFLVPLIPQCSYYHQHQKLSSDKLLLSKMDDDELLQYQIEQINPTINDSMITMLFSEADVVVEGIFTSWEKGIDPRGAKYDIKVSRIFKGVGVSETISVEVGGSPNPDSRLLGEWSHSINSGGVYFLKKYGKDFQFVNPNKAWVTYPKARYIFTHKKSLKEIVYNKILAVEGSFCKETKYLKKKKRQKALECPGD